MKCMYVFPYRSRGGVTEAAELYLEAILKSGINTIVVYPRSLNIKIDFDSTATKSYQIPFLGNSGIINVILSSIFLSILAAINSATFIFLHNGGLIKILSMVSSKPIIAVAHGGALRRFRRASHVIAISETIRAKMLNAGHPDKDISVIKNPFRYALSVDRQINPIPILGTLAAFESVKGIDTLLKAYKKVAETGLSFKAVIAGDGILYEKMRDLKSNLLLDQIVEMPGWIHDKTAFFSTLDLYIQPSRQETWGIAIHEAMAHKVPVIATDCDGPMEFIKNNENGFLVSRDDANALAEQIIALLSHPQSMAHVVDNANTYIKDNFSFDMFQNKIITLLKQLDKSKK